MEYPQASQMTPQPHIPPLFASRISWRITPLCTPSRSLSCPHGFRPHTCSNLVHRPLWSSRLRTQMAPLPPPLSPQGISSASGPASWSGAGINPLPPIDLGWPNPRPLCRKVLQLRPLLWPGLSLTQNSALLGLDPRCLVLLARSTTSPPKLRPLPKAPQPIKRPSLLLASEGSTGSSDAVVNVSCPLVVPPFPSPCLPHFYHRHIPPLPFGNFLVTQHLHWTCHSRLVRG